MSTHTQIKIAPTKAEQAAQRQFIKHVEGVADTLRPDGTVVSDRHKDEFFGGPLHGTICTHQPNGPSAENDPHNYWGDYYFKDKLKIPETYGAVDGYHIYSTVRNIYGDNGYIAPGHATQFGFNTRGTNFRKCYYYLGFFQEGFLEYEGVSPCDFKGVLSVS